MKVRRWVLCALAAVLLFGIIFILSGREKSAPALRTGGVPESSEGNRISVEAAVDAQLRKLKGTMETVWVNGTGQDLDQVVMRVYANEQAMDTFTVQNAWVNGEKRIAHFDEDPTILRFACDWPAGARIQVQMEFTLWLTGDESRILTDSKSCIAAGVLPVPARCADGKWETELAEGLVEPTDADSFSCRIALTLPQQMVCLMGGVPVSETMLPDGNRTVAFAMTEARDLSLVVLGEGSLAQEEVSGCLLTAAASDARRAKALTAAARTAVERLGRLGISLDMTGISFADATYSGGYALSGLILTEAELSGEALIEQMVRSLFRQQLGIRTGVDLKTQAWLSYAMAGYVEMLTYREAFGEERFESRYRNEVEVSTRLTRPYGVTIGAESSLFSDRLELIQTVQEAGSVMMLGLGEACGDPAVLNALNRLMREKAGQFAEPRDLYACLQEETGSDWRGYIEDWLRM